MTVIQQRHILVSKGIVDIISWHKLQIHQFFLFILSFQSLHCMHLFNCSEYTCWIWIWQFWKVTLTITIRSTNLTLVNWIVPQPFVISLGIPNEVMNPYLDGNLSSHDCGQKPTLSMNFSYWFKYDWQICMFILDLIPVSVLSALFLPYPRLGK